MCHSSSELIQVDSATSQPRGPVYLYAPREILEEEIDSSNIDFTSPNYTASKWPSVQLGGLSPHALQTITQAIINAKFPLLITGATDRNLRTIPLLQQLASELSIAVFASCPTQTCFSYSHPCFVGSSYGGKNPLLDDADVIICLEADLPWVDVNGNAARSDARVFVIDSDPLKPGMGWAHTDAEMICKVNAETALEMLLDVVRRDGLAEKVVDTSRKMEELKRRHDAWIGGLQVTEAQVSSTKDGPVVAASVTHAYSRLRECVRAAVEGYAQTQGRQPGSTIWLNETASNHSLLFNHIRMEDDDVARGSMVLASGGSGLGWLLGASVGAVIGGRLREDKPKPDLIVAVVGDGTFIFGIPSAAYWMARRYNTVRFSTPSR